MRCTTVSQSSLQSALKQDWKCSIHKVKKRGHHAITDLHSYSRHGCSANKISYHVCCCYVSFKLLSFYFWGSKLVKFSGQNWRYLLEGNCCFIWIDILSDTMSKVIYPKYSKHWPDTRDSNEWVVKAQDVSWFFCKYIPWYLWFPGV